MVNSVGIIKTIAGTGVSGSSGDGGLATNAQLSTVYGIATDISGNVYIADSTNNKIRMVINNGLSRSVYVLGTVGMQPWGTISGNQNAKWIWSEATSASASYTNTDLWTFSGSFVSSSSYTGTIEVCADDQATVYLNGQIIQSVNYFKILNFQQTPVQSSISVIVGTNTIVVNAQNLVGAAGLLLSIKDSSGNYVFTTGSSWTFQRTSGSIITYAGTGFSGSYGDGGAATSAQLFIPLDVAVDIIGNVYIADTTNNKIRIVNSAGIINTFAGTGLAGSYGDGGAATSAQLNFPRATATDRNGNVYISDMANYKIRIVNSAGIISTFAGGYQGKYGSGGDGGFATSANLYEPDGLAADSNGNVYIADSMNYKIRIVNSAGIISTFAGTGINGNSGDGGPATLAQLSTTYGVATDVSGNVYFADATNKIRVIQSVCSGGYYLSGSNCQACAAGTYNPNPGAASSSACLACASGLSVFLPPPPPLPPCPPLSSSSYKISTLLLQAHITPTRVVLRRQHVFHVQPVTLPLCCFCLPIILLLISLCCFCLPIILLLISLCCFCLPIILLLILLQYPHYFP